MVMPSNIQLWVESIDYSKSSILTRTSNESNINKKFLNKYILNLLKIINNNEI